MVDFEQLLFPSRSERDALFRKFDDNGNGRLSFGEIEGAIEKPWPELKQKRVLMAAFKATDDDLSGYIGKAEFRHFLRYTLFFYRLWLLFTEMDSSGDGRITEQEFRDCIRDPHGTLQVRFHPDEEVNEAYTLQEWTELDPEGDGLILFDNFCMFALRWQLVEDVDQQVQPNTLPGDCSAAERRN